MLDLIKFWLDWLNILQSVESIRMDEIIIVENRFLIYFIKLEHLVAELSTEMRSRSVKSIPYRILVTSVLVACSVRVSHWLKWSTPLEVARNFLKVEETRLFNCFTHESLKHFVSLWRRRLILLFNLWQFSQY